MSKKNITMMTIIIAIMLLIFVCALNIGSAKMDGFYFKPGNCPECGTKLMKGVYGAYSPSVCWYCPNCG